LRALNFSKLSEKTVIKGLCKAFRSGEKMAKREGIFLPIKVRAGAPKNELIMDGERILVKIKEPAQKNRANKELLKFLKKRLNHKEIEIVRGHRSPNKLIYLYGIDKRRLMKRLSS